MATAIRLYYFTSDKYGFENVEKRRLKLSFSNEVNDVFELRPFDFGERQQGRSLRGAWSRAIEKHSLEQGFISFSESWAVPTMWGHYANNHKGVCLGFDLSVRPGDEVQYAEKIKYVKHLHPMDERIYTDAAYNREMVEIARTTKSAHWSYEQEWRCWFSLPAEEKRRKRENPGELFFTEFGSNLRLKEIVVGCRSTLTSESFRRVLQPEEKVRFTTARPSFREFAMVPQRNPSLAK